MVQPGGFSYTTLKSVSSLVAAPTSVDTHSSNDTLSSTWSSAPFSLPAQLPFFFLFPFFFFELGSVLSCVSAPLTASFIGLVLSHHAIKKLSSFAYGHVEVEKLDGDVLREDMDVNRSDHGIDKTLR